MVQSQTQLDETQLCRCECGVVMRIPLNRPGKRYLCPKCRSHITVEVNAISSVHDKRVIKNKPVKTGPSTTLKTFSDMSGLSDLNLDLNTIEDHSDQIQKGHQCPSCKTYLRVGAHICIPCGINVLTGALVDTSGLSVQEEEDEVFVETKKPFLIMASSMIIFIATCAYLLTSINSHEKVQNYMLWFGNKNNTATYDNYDKYIQSYAFPGEMNLKELQTFIRMHENNGLRRTDPYLSAYVKELGVKVKENFIDKNRRTRKLREPEPAHLQVFTYGFVHNDFMHSCLIVAFLLTAGIGVNKYIGNIMTFAIYLSFTAIPATLISLIFKGGSYNYITGASGVAMGFAGMYFIFFYGKKIQSLDWMKILLEAKPDLLPSGFPIKTGIWIILITLITAGLSIALWQYNPAAIAIHAIGFILGLSVATLLLKLNVIDTAGNDFFSSLSGKKTSKVNDQTNQGRCPTWLQWAQKLP